MGYFTGSAARIVTRRCAINTNRVVGNKKNVCNTRNGSSSSFPAMADRTAVGTTTTTTSRQKFSKITSGGSTSSSSSSSSSSLPFRSKTTSSSSSSSSSTRSTRYSRPIGCHLTSYLGQTTTSLLSLMEPSNVTLSLDCEDGDDVDGT